MKTKRVYFICLTTTHFFQVLYYIHRVHWDEQAEKILVWARAGKTRPEIKPYEHLFDRVFYVDFANLHDSVRSKMEQLRKAGRLFPFSELGRFMRESVSDNMLVLFNDSDYCTSKYIDFFSRRKNNEIVILDEGSALYFDQMPYSSPRDSSAWGRRLVNAVLGVRANDLIGSDPKIDVVIAQHPERLPMSRRCGRRVIPQNDIFRDAEFLRQIQEQIAERLPQKSGKCVLWLGQPAEEVNLEEHEEEALLDVFQTFARENFQILVKPHPRESSDKYLRIAKKAGVEENLRVIELGELYWIPIEAYVSLIAPEAVACFFSTAASRIRDLGYICNTWYCFDLLKENLENDYLRRETERPRTFRIRSRKELEETLKSQNIAEGSGRMQIEERLQDGSSGQDIAFFEQFGGE